MATQRVATLAPAQSILDALRRMFSARPADSRARYVRGWRTRTGTLRARSGPIDFRAKHRRTDQRVQQLPRPHVHRTIAALTQLAESTVVRGLRELEDHGLVSHRQRVSRRGQSSNLYEIHDLNTVDAEDPPS